MKRTIGFLGLILTLLFFASGTSALICTQSDIPADGPVLLKLARQTNAHAERPNQTNYTYGIRCRENNIPGVTINTGTSNPVNVMRISGITNAHAEEAGLSNYTTLVQMGHNGTGSIYVGTVTDPASNCSSLNDTPVVGTVYTEFARLSGPTNAHLESPLAIPVSYTVRICASYFGGAGPPNQDIILIGTSAFPGLTGNIPGSGLPTNQTASIYSQNSSPQGIITTSRVYSDSSYTNVTSLQVAAICTTSNPACNSITEDTAGYNGVTGEVSAFAAGGPLTFLLPETFRVILYGGGSPYSTLYGQLQTRLAQYPSAITQTDSDLTGVQTTTAPPYTVNPTMMNLAPGNYKFVVVDYAAKYDYPANPNQTEFVTWVPNNIRIMTFSVIPGGGGPGVGSGEDVYLVKKISFPNLFQGQNIQADITVETKKFGDPNYQNPLVANAKLRVCIRKEDGSYLTGFGSNDPICADRDVTFLPFTTMGTDPISTQTHSVGIETLAPWNLLTIGETYTLFATIVPYDGTVGTTYDESVVGNNSAFQTFTKVQAPQAVAVPDAPWWMSLVLVSIIMGWLYFSTRGKKEDEKGSHAQRGRFAFRE